MRGPPLSRGAAPLDAETIKTLRDEAAKPGMTAEKVRKQLVPSVSGATFHRALRGLKVSVPVQRACSDLASVIRSGHEGGMPYDFDPDPEAA